MNAQLKLQWNNWSDRFAALNQRERMLVAAAAVGGLLYLGAVLWVEPMFVRAKSYAHQSATQATELTNLQQQIVVLGQQVATDPNAPLRTEQLRIQQQLKDADALLSEFDASLVPPSKTAGLLDSLIRKSSGVRLVGFKTIPVEGLLASKQKTTASLPGQNKIAADLAPALAADVFKHGFELKLRGNYLALLAFLKTQEAQPERLLWQRAQLVVDGYPEAELTLTIYTLSMDKHWLEL